MSGVPLHIEDQPRFPHRGLLIDSGRHFEPVLHLKALLDSMSYAKMNVLHWHLTEEDGTCDLRMDYDPNIVITIYYENLVKKNGLFMFLELATSYKFADQDQSFPIASRVFPELPAKGAYSDFEQ